MNEPADPELWRLTLAAVRGAAVAADSYVNRGLWCPRINLPTIESFDSGWPHVRRPITSASDTSPIDYAALFGPKKGSATPIAYTDVEELASLISYVRGHENLRARVALEPVIDPEDIIDAFIDIEIVNLPLSILSRARAKGLTTDDDLFVLYVERERSWLEEALPVDYIIPLALTPLSLTDTLVIDTKTAIEPLDDATQAARALASSAFGNVPEPVIGAATHAIVLSDRQIQNPGTLRRKFIRRHLAAPPADADLVCDSLRTLSPTDIGYAQVLYRPIGWADGWKHDLPPLTEMAVFRRYPEKFDNFLWLENPDQIDHDMLAPLPTIVAGLRGASPNIRLAARRLSLAALRDDDDDQTVDACIGLEALLGEGKDELSHRMALRAATALATRPESPANAQAVYDAIRKVYSHRSAVVHGTKGDRSRIIAMNDSTFKAADLAVSFLRVLLRDVLTRPGGWTAKSLDVKLLTSLRPAMLSDDFYSEG